MIKYNVKFLMTFIVGLIALLISLSFIWLDKGSKAVEEQTAIKQTVIDYCVAVKANDRNKITYLIARTPTYYWDRSISEQTKQIKGENAKATVSENNSDFAEKDYSNLLEIKPLAWRGLIIPSDDELKVRINGDYAIVRASLKSQGSFSFENDFLLVKSNGEWKIFKIALPLPDQTFPFKDKISFASD